MVPVEGAAAVSRRSDRMTLILCMFLMWIFLYIMGLLWRMYWTVFEFVLKLGGVPIETRQH